MPTGKSRVVYTSTSVKLSKILGRVSWPGPNGRVYSFWREQHQRWSFVVDQQRRLLLNCSPPAHDGTLDVLPAMLVCERCNKAYSHLTVRRNPHWCDECRMEVIYALAAELQEAGIELGVHPMKQSEHFAIARDKYGFCPMAASRIRR